MTNILISGDWQLTDNPRDDYRWDFIEHTLPKMLREYNVDWLYFLGDLCEAKDEHPASLVNRVTDNLKRLAEKTDIAILQGNHDVLDIAHPFFQFLSHFEGIHWINKPMQFNNALWLPHTRNYKRDWKDIRLDGQIFAHNIFEGTRAGNGHVLDGIPLNVFKQGAKVISGDVHENQSFKFVTYVGSPYLCDFGDDYDPRVMLASNGKIKSIPVPGPQKRLIECSVNKGLWSWQANAGDILKVRVSIQRKHVERWHEIKQDITNCCKKNGYVLHSVEPIMNDQPEHIEGPRITNKTDEEYIREYAERRGLDDNTIKVGMTFLN